MSDDINFLYDTFNLYYDKGMKAKDQKNYEVAKKNLLLAAQTMLKLAMASKGELKKVRMEHATRLTQFANRLQKVEAPRPSIAQAGSAPSAGARPEDDTETIWKESSIPEVSFNDVAGLEDVKESVRMRIILPLQYPDIYKAYDKKIGGGILLYGLPGTGKTMVAQAIANEVRAAFYAVKCSDVVSKWFGEAEKNIRNLFEEARKNERAIIFFDEFEALGAKRGGNSTVMNRLVPELLAQIQGFNVSNGTMLLIAATNRPWDIDSAMLRPGRFNELIYIPLPDYEARKAMITKKLSSLPIDPDVGFDYLADITDGFNGSDIDEFCDRLKNDPIKRSILSNRIENINMQDVEKIRQTVKSSVSPEDVDNFRKYNENRSIG